MTRSRAVLVALVAVAAAGISGCNGVPSSSAPETIEAIAPGNPGDAVSIVPPFGADPREIVEKFLQANPTDPANHSGARAFLTSQARDHWSDKTATVIDAAVVGTYSASSHTLRVSGREIGTLDPNGIYTPSLQGDGTGGDIVQFRFRLRTVKGQYRIDSLPNGLILTNDQFRADYQPHNVYFYDAAQRYLVPDPRYTALQTRSALADWLLRQLVSGPNPALTSAVSIDTLPPQAQPEHVAANLGALTTVDVPGAAQLNADQRNRLAAQVAETLSDAVSGLPMALTDGTAPVEIPAVSGTKFSASDFSASSEPPTPSPDVYYLYKGRLYNEDGHPVIGPLGSGAYNLRSVAVHRAGVNGPLVVAAVAGGAANSRLYVGSQTAGLAATRIIGRLSRPAFAPGPPSRREVWIGAGPTLYRALVNGTTAKITKVSLPPVDGGRRIVAVRVSPDGSRVALVIAGAKGTAQLYIGAIVRGVGAVRVDSLQPISPQGVVIADVAWLDTLQLLAIGTMATSGDSRTFETSLDGAGWSARPTGGLPNAPESVTAAPSALAWVSSDGFIWVQSGTDWVSPGSEAQQPGNNPVYLA